ncbi:MAG TPA: hypothetical protein VGJ25_13800 [Gaiellaceae bacterium]|jgi:hypothetical protein
MATLSEQTAHPEQPIEPAPTGPAAAVTLAAGIGVLVLGIVTTLAEASTSVSDGLQWNDRVGPLSGKTIIASAAFFAAWGVLAALWRRSSLPLRPVLVATGILIAFGLLGTFPTFFQTFAP